MIRSRQFSAEPPVEPTRLASAVFVEVSGFIELGFAWLTLDVRQRVFFWIDESPMHVVRVKPFAHQLVKVVDANVIDTRI